MAQPSTFTACHQVFETAELAENIFLDLPMQDLLVRVHRVCKLWKRIIFASPSIQQVLFLRPITTKKVQYYGSSDYVDEDSKVGVLLPMEHPFLTKFRKRYRSSKSDECFSNAAWWRPEVSWRRNLLTQPPIKRLNVVCHYDEDPMKEEDVWVEGNGAGVKVVDIKPYLHLTFADDWIKGDYLWRKYNLGYQQLREVLDMVSAFKRRRQCWRRIRNLVPVRVIHDSDLE